MLCCLPWRCRATATTKHSHTTTARTLLRVPLRPSAPASLPSTITTHPRPPKWAAGAYTTPFSECISIEKGRDRTQNYTDEVLVTKVANIMYVPSSALRPRSERPSHTLLMSLVVGAHRNGVIQRSKEKPDENAKLQISYEAFVESLDDEDAFTTKLVEILLKVGFALPWSLFSSLLKTRWLF